MSYFHRLIFHLPSSEQDWFSLELFARGADGVSVDESAESLQLVAYCPDPLPTELETVGASWMARGIRLARVERRESRDWLAAYRAASVPLEIGRGFLVDPREPQESEKDSRPASDRILLRVPARRAFGTGSHPSTRLVLEWMEDLDLRGRRVLDVGTGTGILSMAALHLGAAEAIGVDIDPVACFVASETLELNRSPVRLISGGLSCLAGEPFDVALVNILPREWLAEAVGLGSRLTHDGYAILSGIPADDAEEVSAELLRSSLEPVERRISGDWAVLRVRRSE